jgi:adenylate kinase family enzyme
MLKTSASNSDSTNQPHSEANVLERVVVIGCSCAGKTRFAQRLSHALEVPNIELDAMHWLPDWVERPNKEFKMLVEEAVTDGRWVADGNYGQVRDIVWQRATCLIWLNYSFRVVFWRALRRTCIRVFTRQRVYSGNTESFRRAFLSKDSILLWVLSTYHKRRREFPTIFAQHHFSMLRVIEFKSPRDADEFIRGLAD